MPTQHRPTVNSITYKYHGAICQMGPFIISYGIICTDPFSRGEAEQKWNSFDVTE